MFAWVSRKKHNLDIAGWEWLVEQLDDIESMPCPFLDASELTRQILGFVEYEPGTYDQQLTDRWIKALRS